MGGKGSGGHNSLTDEEKKARGTFRADRSEAARLADAAKTVITGPWLLDVPKPTLPLNEVGRAKYDEYTKLLLDGGKLTRVVCDDIERYAVMHQQMDARLKAGKTVSMDLLKQMNSIAVRLRIADNAPTIASPGARNKFASIGTAATVVQTFRLRRPSSS